MCIRCHYRLFNPFKCVHCSPRDCPNSLPGQASTLSDRFIHLCNHAIQKERSAAPSSAAKLMSAPSGPSLNARVGDGKGIGKKDSGSAGDDGGRGIEVDSLHPSGSQSNMWSVDQFRRYLFDHFQVSKQVYLCRERLRLYRRSNPDARTMLTELTSFWRANNQK